MGEQGKHIEKRSHEVSTLLLKNSTSDQRPTDHWYESRIPMPKTKSKDQKTKTKAKDQSQRPKTKGSSISSKSPTTCNHTEKKGSNENDARDATASETSYGKNWAAAKSLSKTATSYKIFNAKLVNLGGTTIYSLKEHRPETFTKNGTVYVGRHIWKASFDTHLQIKRFTQPLPTFT